MAGEDTDPNENENPNEDPNEEEQPNEGAGGEEETEFKAPATQAEFDSMVKSRIARERKKYEGFDDLKKKAEEFDKLQEAQMSELEKAQTRAAELEREAEQAKTQARENLTRSAVVAEAARQNALDPDDVVALLDRTLLDFDEDGTPKPETVKEAVSTLLTAKPHLVSGGNGRQGADQGARRSAGASSLEDEDDPKKVVESVKGLRS